MHLCWVEREVLGDEEHQQERTAQPAREASTGLPEDLQCPKIKYLNHLLLLFASVNYYVLLEGKLKRQNQFLTTFFHDLHVLTLVSQWEACGLESSGTRKAYLHLASMRLTKGIHYAKGIHNVKGIHCAKGIHYAEGIRYAKGICQAKSACYPTLQTICIFCLLDVF